MMHSRSTRRLTMVALAAGGLTTTNAIAAQTLASRLDAIRDGTVRFEFAARPGTCGDGGERIRFRSATFTANSFGTHDDDWDVPCRAGPLRISLEREGGLTARLRAHVGGGWEAAVGARDLGEVPAPDAARWLLEQLPALDRRSADRALAAAALASGVQISADLARTVRDERVPRDTRTTALFWISAIGEPEGPRLLRQAGGDDRLDDEIRGAAIIALSEHGLDDDDAAFLRRLFPGAKRHLRDGILLAASRSEDDRMYAWLASIVTDGDQPAETRSQALFWLGQGHAPTGTLAALYDRLESRAVRQQFTFVLSQRHDREATDKLIDIARRDDDREVRRQAFFWLGQSKDERARSFLREMVLR